MPVEEEEAEEDEEEEEVYPTFYLTDKFICLVPVPNCIKKIFHVHIFKLAYSQCNNDLPKK